MSFTNQQPHPATTNNAWGLGDTTSFANTVDAAELANLMLDDCCLTAFSKISGIPEIPLYDPTMLDGITGLNGTVVWVNHSIRNPNTPTSAVVMGDTIRHLLTAIDDALSDNLSPEEQNGGRCCYLEDAFYPAEDEYTRANGISPNDIVIQLGS